MPHIIRLRGPWQIHAEEAGAAHPTRLAMPCAAEEMLMIPGGGVRFERRFQRPTGLTAESQVDLVIAQYAATADGVHFLLRDMVLNGSPLSAQPAVDGPEAWRFPIQSRLQATNLLELHVQRTPVAGERETPTAEAQFCDVWLEIED